MKNKVPKTELVQQPKSLIDLAALQEQYPDPLQVDVMGLCERVVSRSDSDTIREDLYGPKEQWRGTAYTGRLIRDMHPARLATGLFIKSFNEGIAAAKDIDQLSWRLEAFSVSQDPSRPYIGAPLSVRAPGDQSPLKERDLYQSTRLGMSMVQVVKFCEANPELEDAAINTWIKSSLVAPILVTRERISTPRIGDVMLKTVEQELGYGQEETVRKERERLLMRLSSHAQWQRKSPKEHETIDRLLISSLELVPIYELSLEYIEKVKNRIMAEDYAPKKPATLIVSSVKAAQNLLSSLVPSKRDRKSLTGRLVADLEQYDGDNPLTYGDVILLADRLTPLLMKQNPDITGLTPDMLEDYPKAIDRLLFIALAENQSRLHENDQLELFMVAADCIKRLAFKGVEAKLAQRVLSVGDVALRYSNMPPEKRRDLIERMQARGLGETAIERTARQMSPRNPHRPNKPGWGVRS